jgi:hypothetical protein
MSAVISSPTGTQKVTLGVRALLLRRFEVSSCDTSVTGATAELGVA